MLAEIRSGLVSLTDGTVAPARASRVGGMCVAEAQGRYYEATSRSTVFSLCMKILTTASPAAINILAGAAQANAGFTIWNPQNSGRNLSLLKFSVGVGSGTYAAAGGPIWHATYTAPALSTVSVATDGTIVCNNVASPPVSVAKYICVAAGNSATTGGGATTPISVADLAFALATIVVTPQTVQRCMEYIDGCIVIPPGWAWAPQWPAAGTLFYVTYSITWEEIPI
jgi:hypothetical protein